MLIKIKRFIKWGPVAARITLWASGSHSSSLTKVRSVYLYIKQTYPENFINITALIIPHAHLPEDTAFGVNTHLVHFIGAQDSLRPAWQPLSCQIHGRPDHPCYWPLHWHSKQHSDAVEEERELRLLAPDYLAVVPLSVIFSMLVECCLVLL